LALKRVLNVGGNSKAIRLPRQYTGFEHILLDIDPKGAPDIVCDARLLKTLEGGSFDAVYCSHNLEHYYRHDVPKVLSGFLHVLKEGGFAQVRVPDLAKLMRLAVERRLDIEDVLYKSPAGPVMVLDVIYGHSGKIARSGEDFFAHKTGFTRKSLIAALRRSGFSSVYSAVGKLEINAVAFKGKPDAATKALFRLPEA
jgi:SAM-dependent methyltransferase